MSKDLSVVVPAYNESKTIGLVIDRLMASLAEFEYEIVIVDDASKDNTSEVIDEIMLHHENIRLIRHPLNQGKTGALRTGFKECRGRVVIVQDADLEYDPADISRVVAPILDRSAQVVYGSRFSGKEHKNTFLFRSYFANRVLTFFSNFFTRYKFTDVETCYKAFRREIIQAMLIESSRFGFEIEVTAKLSKLDLHITEIPITFSSRSYAEGKKIGFKDGLQALFYILKYNLFTSKEHSFNDLSALQKALKN